MDTENTPFSLKKIPYNLSLILLTSGASIILGFLSFGGMYALMPILPLAFAAFGLSVAYEGEIYLQNLKGSLKKLFNFNYLEHYLAKEYLLAHFPEDIDAPDCPQFFKDYVTQLKLLSGFGDKILNPQSKKQKKKIEKILTDMEQWFALQLFVTKRNTNKDTSEYAKTLQLWLNAHQLEEWQEKLAARKFNFNLVKSFSVLAGVFMSLGSTYLIVEAFSVIPFFAAIPFPLWPIMIVPMALIAGSAYGLLTFNAITDLINNNTLAKWYNKLRNDLSQGLTVRNVFMATTAILLVGLALTLTVCTAGTWWTVATNARPLFEWMKKMPSLIMGAVNPIITGLSAVFFNIQNTAESMDLVDETLKSDENIFQTIYKSIVQGLKHLIETENWAQRLNPFRIILKLTITPLRILFFLGHLASIAVTSDRMPGVPQIVAALIAMISEGFEDAHYFVGHGHDDDHDHHDHHHDHHDHHYLNIKEVLLKKRLDVNAGHSHDVDIPTWLLKTITIPVYALAAGWDSIASKLNKPTHAGDAESTYSPNRKALTFWQAWNKQRSIPEETEVTLPADAQHPSKEWQVEHTLALIEKHQTQHLNATHCGKTLAGEKSTALDALKKEIREPKVGETLAQSLARAKNQPVYNQHRLFPSAEKTMTQEFIDALPGRVNAVYP